MFTLIDRAMLRGQREEPFAFVVIA